MSDQNLPAELFPNYCTLEYTLQASVAPSPPAYVFVVDTCLAEDELAACRAALSQALQMIPEYAQARGVRWLTPAYVSSVVHPNGLRELCPGRRS